MPRQVRSTRTSRSPSSMHRRFRLTSHAKFRSNTLECWCGDWLIVAARPETPVVILLLYCLVVPLRAQLALDMINQLNMRPGRRFLLSPLNWERLHFLPLSMICASYKSHVTHMIVLAWHARKWSWWTLNINTLFHYYAYQMYLHARLVWY